jgi:uncharacterized membrane protein HdeD (DUF308 family)
MFKPNCQELFYILALAIANICSSILVGNLSIKRTRIPGKSTFNIETLRDMHDAQLWAVTLPLLALLITVSAVYEICMFKPNCQELFYILALAIANIFRLILVGNLSIRRTRIHGKSTLNI